MRWTRLTLVITEAFVALSAFVAGAMFAVEPSGRLMGMTEVTLARSPFWMHPPPGTGARVSRSVAVMAQLPQLDRVSPHRVSTQVIPWCTKTHRGNCRRIASSCAPEHSGFSAAPTATSREIAGGTAPVLTCPKTQDRSALTQCQPPRLAPCV
jgi:hypothetical protein